MDYKALIPLAQAVANAGFPVLGNILGTVLPFPANMVAKTVLTAIAAAVGAPADDPQAVADAVNANPAAVSDKLAEIESANKSDFDFAQLQVSQNNAELATGNLFLSGWRPAFAWLCVFGVAYQMFGAVWWHMHVIPPETWNPIWVAFGGLLGLRSIEKWLGVAPVVDKVKVIPDAIKSVFKKKKR